jgi:hypothetical protein
VVARILGAFLMGLSSQNQKYLAWKEGAARNKQHVVLMLPYPELIDVALRAATDARRGSGDEN